MELSKKWMRAEPATAVPRCVVISASLKRSSLAAGRKYVPWGEWKCKECSGWFMMSSQRVWGPAHSWWVPLCLRMKSISVKEDCHDMKSVAQDSHLWTLSLSPALGCQCWAEPNYFSRERGSFYNYFSCGRKVMLAVGVQHSCPRCSPPAALCPGCCSVRKLDAQPVAWRQQCAPKPRLLQAFRVDSKDWTIKEHIR